MQLTEIKRNHAGLLIAMGNHYSQPKGFVGRTIAYQVTYDGIIYGYIVAGSSTRYLPGRDEFFDINTDADLELIINNVFFQCWPVNGKYPIRNFTTAVVKAFRLKVKYAWYYKYGNKIIGYETLVQLPRTGDLYLRDGWQVVGTTKGYSCKRESGKGTDNWTGKRVWNTTDLKPKLVLCKKDQCLY